LAKTHAKNDGDLARDRLVQISKTFNANLASKLSRLFYFLTINSALARLSLQTVDRYMFPDDSELIRNFKNGNEEAFVALVRKYQRPLFTFLLRLVGNQQSAEDLFQDTFVRVLRALPGYKEDVRLALRHCE